MSEMTELMKLGAACREAARTLALAGTGVKNRALQTIAGALVKNTGKILEANAVDMKNAKLGGMSDSLQDRLLLTKERIDGIAQGVLEVAALPDPIGEVISMTTRPNGLTIGQKRVPLGVIGIIFEARPNVTVDAAVLCVKSGNAVMLRGGKEAIESNRAFAEIMRNALRESGLPEDCVCLVTDTGRESAAEMMRLTGYLDVLIPRGGAGLIKSVVENATVPTIHTGVGICHLYIDEAADLQMGTDILYNAKCSRPSVCNAVETLLVARAVAADFLPAAKEVLSKKQVELRGCAETVRLLGGGVKPASREDYYTEFGDYILAVKVVSDLDEAISFINKTGSGHSEAIVTSNYFSAQRFLNEVDAAAVYVNASTRFTDGSEFGMGAEIGISTQKMHARGPMGLPQLTSTKFIIYGEGQVR